MLPNKDTALLPEKRAESKKMKTIPSPERRSADLGKIILPSINLDIAQKIIERVSPTTKSNPFPTAIEMVVKGRQKTGNKTITKNSEINESRSKMFEYIDYIIYCGETFCKGF